MPGIVGGANGEGESAASCRVAVVCRRYTQYSEETAALTVRENCRRETRKGKIPHSHLSLCSKQANSMF